MGIKEVLSSVLIVVLCAAVAGVIIYDEYQKRELRNEMIEYLRDH